MSPGTTTRRGNSCQRPSRSTVAVGVTDARSRSAARSEWKRLPEVDRDAQHHDRHDDRRVDTLAQRGGNQARDQENDDERVAEQVAQLHERRESASGGRFVRSELRESNCRLGARQPNWFGRHRVLECWRVTNRSRQRDNHATLTLTVVGLAAAIFGRCTLSTPSLYSACTLAASTSAGSANCRTNLP